MEGSSGRRSVRRIQSYWWRLRGGISMIDYKKDTLVDFTTRGKLSTCDLNGKTVTCITNEYDVPIIISAPSVLIYDKTGKIIY